MSMETDTEIETRAYQRPAAIPKYWAETSSSSPPQGLELSLRSHQIYKLNACTVQPTSGKPLTAFGNNHTEPSLAASPSASILAYSPTLIGV